MNSRQRVLAALNHQEPDRVPLDFSGHRASGINAVAYARLRRFLGLEVKPIRVYDFIQQLAIVDEDVLERFGVDTIPLEQEFVRGDEVWIDWALTDGTPAKMPAWLHPQRVDGEWVIRSKGGRIIGRMPEGCLFFEQANYPFAEGADLENIPGAMEECFWTAIPNPPGPLVAGPDGPRLLAEGARRLRERTDRAVLATFGGKLMEMGQFLYRHDNFFILLASEPKEAHEFLDRLVEMYLPRLETLLGAVGDFIDIIVFGDDLGIQTGPMISPRMYREFFKPRQKVMWDRVKELADVKILFHCCGSMGAFIPDLIEAGVEAINPVQISAADMDVAKLKREFGKDVTFWGGGCDTHRILPRGTPEEVREHAREQVEILKPGGGFVFQQVHNILADVPPENIVAMLDAVNR